MFFFFFHFSSETNLFIILLLDFFLGGRKWIADGSLINRKQAPAMNSNLTESR